MIMTLEEILNRSKSDRYGYNYPDVFTDDCGLDIRWSPGRLYATPSWGHTPNNAIRRATVKISSFRGVSIGAIHYYATINVQGVWMVYEDEPNMSTIDMECEKQFPLSEKLYCLRLTRPITEEEIALDNELGDYLSRFKYQKAGDLTQCWESQEEILEFAKEVFRLRFKGEWEFYVEWENGQKEKVAL